MSQAALTAGTTALNALSPAIPFATGAYKTADGAALPETYIVITEITGVPEQHADDVETQRTHRVQVSIFSRAGLAALPNVKGVMEAQGFRKGPERQLPYDQDTKHFGWSEDYFYTEVSNA